METNKNNRLQELGGSDYEIADGQPDIKGWEVTDKQGKIIGEVDELIFDTQALKVRYLVLDLKENSFNLSTQNVLVPIGLAELHEEDDDVILPGVTAEQLRALPEYKKGNITGDMESSVRNAFSDAGLATGSAAVLGAGTEMPDFYDHQDFNENALYQRRQAGKSESNTTDTPENPAPIQVIEETLQVGKKKVETGGIRLNSRIVERPIEEEITLRTEMVNVERVNVNRPATASDFREGVVEVSEFAEVPVVNKEAYVVEEIQLHKDVNEKEETIRDTVRSTEVDIEKIDKNDKIS